jgi:hypothetical protein
MKTKKKFDCVKMKDEAQMRRAERLGALTTEERLAFYGQAHEALDHRQKQLSQRESAARRGPDRSFDSADPES